MSDKLSFTLTNQVVRNTLFIYSCLLMGVFQWERFLEVKLLVKEYALVVAIGTARLFSIKVISVGTPTRNE